MFLYINKDGMRVEFVDLQTHHLFFFPFLFFFFLVNFLAPNQSTSSYLSEWRPRAHFWVWNLCSFFFFLNLLFLKHSGKLLKNQQNSQLLKNKDILICNLKPVKITLRVYIHMPGKQKQKLIGKTLMQVPEMISLDSA